MMKIKLLILMMLFSLGLSAQTNWTNVGNGLQQRVVAGKTEYRFIKTTGYTPFGISDSLSNFIGSETTDTIRGVKNFMYDVYLKNDLLQENTTTEIDVNSVNGISAPSPLITPTYDGSGQALHPDVYYNANSWNGYKYWMAMTPYRTARQRFENPSILVSNDGKTWINPTGITNPIVPEPADSANYNLDTEIIPPGAFDNKMRVMYAYYQQNINRVTWYTKTISGTTIGSPVVAIPAALPGMVSPCVIEKNGTYIMYYVDWSVSPYQIKKRIASNPEGPWSSPVICSVPNISGSDFWHLNANVMGDEIHLWVNTTISGGKGNVPTKMYFASSKDGLNFKIATNAIGIGSDSGWDWKNSIYRGSAIQIDGAKKRYGLYYSARPDTTLAPHGLYWRIGYTEINLDNLNGTVTNVSSANSNISVSNQSTTPILTLAPTISSNTSGNATTATALQTARTINGVSFNGSENITVIDATKLPLTGGTLTGALNGTSFVSTGGNNGFTLKGSTSVGSNWVRFENNAAVNYLNFGNIAGGNNDTYYSIPVSGLAHRFVTNGIERLNISDASITSTVPIKGITPTVAADFTIKSYVDAADALKANLAGSASQAFSASNITSSFSTITGDNTGTVPTLLSMNGTGTNPRRLSLGVNTSGTPYGYIQSDQANISNSNTPLAINPNGGNVAIGATTASEKLTVSGNISASGTATFATPTLSTHGSTKGYVDDITRNYTASGNGSSTSIVIPHGKTGITSASKAVPAARNAASAGWSYYSIDATNITLFYTAAPVSGTNNLNYSITIIP